MSYRLAAVAGLVLAVLPAAAQESPLPDLFSEVIDVRVVNVEVVVTDREGNRIRGLDAADFELRVDGESVPVDYFTEIDEGIARTNAEGDAIGAVSSLVAGEPVATNYLVFIDEYFAVRRDRDRVLERLEQDLGRLGAHDRVALVAFDGQNVSQLTDWTGSRDVLRGAFGEAASEVMPPDIVSAHGVPALSVAGLLGVPGCHLPGAFHEFALRIR